MEEDADWDPSLEMLSRVSAPVASPRSVTADATTACMHGLFWANLGGSCIHKLHALGHLAALLVSVALHVVQLH